MKTTTKGARATGLPFHWEAPNMDETLAREIAEEAAVAAINRERWEPLSEAQAQHVAEIARKVAREEIASLAGMILRRSTDDELGPNENAKPLRILFGEALRDFSGPTQPGH